jgi:hypothetical protein
MNFRPFFYLSMFIHGKNNSLVEELQFLNQKIATLQSERHLLHQQLFFESQNKVWKAARVTYSNFQNTTTSIPLIL